MRLRVLAGPPLRGVRAMAPEKQLQAANAQVGAKRTHGMSMLFAGAHIQTLTQAQAQERAARAAAEAEEERNGRKEGAKRARLSEPGPGRAGTSVYQSGGGGWSKAGRGGPLPVLPAISSAKVCDCYCD